MEQFKQALKQKFTAFVDSRQTRGFFISVIVMAIISVAFFLPDNFEGNDLRQHDMVQGMANSKEIVDYREATGEKSWWTNSLFSGMPTFQISPSYESNSLISWVTKVYGLGLPAPSNLLFMMMLGFMILMMAMGIRWEYGLMGAIAWGLSSYFVIIIGAGHIWKFVTLAYIPPTIAGIWLAYHGRLLAGGAMAAFFAMMQISSNHVQMTYYFGFLILAIIVATLASAVSAKRVKSWAKATGVLAVAALLAVAANIPNLYHTAKYAKETQRAASELVVENNNGSTGVDKNFITQYSYGKAETFTLMIPNVKGGATIKPIKGQPSLVSLGELENAKDYTTPGMRELLGQVPQYFGEPEATNGPVYVGVIIVALFILGCVIVPGPWKWALLVATLLSIFLAWGRNFMTLTDLFIDIVPMYSKFRSPESILVIAQFTMPLLAVMALVKVMTSEPQRYFKAIAITFGAVGLLCFIGWIAPGFYGVKDQLTDQLLEYSRVEPAYLEAYNAVIDLRHSMVAADSLRSLLLLAVATTAIILWQKQKIKSTAVVAGILVAAVAIDLYTVDKRYVSHESFVKVMPHTATITPTPVDNAILTDTDPNYRVLDLDRISSPEPSYFHKAIGGYHAAKLGRYQDLLERYIYPVAYSQEEEPAITESEYGVFNMLNARYIVYKGQVMENPDANGNAWWLSSLRFVDGANAEMDALATIDLSSEGVADSRFRDILSGVSAPAEGDTIYLTSYAPNRLTYKAHSANGGVAAFSEVYFPWGWNVEIDGHKAQLGRVNYLLRALKIPAGEHEIVMTFAPKSIATTELIAFFAIVAIFHWLGAVILFPLIGNPKSWLRFKRR